MKFKEKSETIYCNNKYYKEYNKGGFYFYDRYYYNGYLVHREDGPAREYNGDKDWYFKGTKCTEEEYKKMTSLKKKSEVLDEI